MRYPIVINNHQLAWTIKFIMLGAMGYAPFANADITTDTQVLTSSTPSATFPEIVITAEKATEDSYIATKAPVILKSNGSLFETPQSVSVVTRQQLDQKQATTLADALKGVAGVTTGQYGRRGWDDLTIRGQLASSQILVDGLRGSSSSNILTNNDISGLESVEVVKGPDSVGFGQVMPGGLVNLTTKKPRSNTFKKITLTAGNEGYKDGAFDLNYAPNHTSKGAFRLNGHISDQDDATDYVYFKNYYLAPSYTFDMGSNTDLTVLASYQKHDYIRQQGLPLQNDTYKKYDSSLFFGEPKYNVEDETYRFGYQLQHGFANDWQLKQNFMLTHRDMDGKVILANGISPMDSKGNIKRQLNEQDKTDNIITLDTHFDKDFYVDQGKHSVMVGLDGYHEKSDYKAVVSDYSSLNLSNPVYGVGKVTRVRSDNDNINYLQYLGLYAKDTIDFNNKWLVNLVGRHDWSDVESRNVYTQAKLKSADNAFTGSAAVMYRYNNLIAPYMSYATSFLTTTDMGEDGKILDPEEGKQFEMGIKLQSDDKRLQGALSYYDLTRKNVSEAVTGTNYNVQIGEQKTKGYELELGGMLTDQLKATANYSYIPTAKTTDSVVSTDIGKRINHVPKNAYGLSTQYYFSPSQLGWYLGGGVHYEGEHSAERSTSKVTLPSYRLYNLQAGYTANNWQLGLTINNLTDQEYYVGTTPNASMVMFGEPRTFKVNLAYKF